MNKCKCPLIDTESECVIDGVLCSKQDKMVIVEVFQGVVSEVKNLPKGWTYRVVDLDVEDRL